MMLGGFSWPSVVRPTTTVVVARTQLCPGWGIPMEFAGLQDQIPHPLFSFDNSSCETRTSLTLSKWWPDFARLVRVPPSLRAGSVRDVWEQHILAERVQSQSRVVLCERKSWGNIRLTNLISWSNPKRIFPCWLECVR